MSKTSQKKVDIQVPCQQCLKVVSRSNMSRHLSQYCPVALGRAESGSVEPSSRDVSESPSRGRSRQVKTGARRRRSQSGSGERRASTSSTPSVATFEKNVSSATVEKAALALLDRHHEYNKDALCAFLARCYPDIPAVCRKVLVVAATTGARRAAQLHAMVVRPGRSESSRFGTFVANSVDVLDCWSLGLDPPHRAGRTYERHQLLNAEADVRRVSADGGSAPPSESSSVTTRVRNAMASKFLPVPLPMRRLNLEPGGDLVAQALTEAGLDDIVSRYDVGDAQQQDRDAHLREIGTAVAAAGDTRKVVCRDEQYEPAPVVCPSAESTFPVYTPTPVAVTRAAADAPVMLTT
ncbi:MAG TPA: hypothetical protein VLS45_10405, partial [Methylomicrobium sp.]|nr:hypothetical protein [Methylomicrobium sp.]